ncbi:MAG: hypothetical protein CMG33_04595 [Candidatus Marinimicrobia bacterium]|nr:hypothetical protein [Candidatus Neomarinimicrobiota bacterium]
MGYFFHPKLNLIQTSYHYIQGLLIKNLESFIAYTDLQLMNHPSKIISSILLQGPELLYNN